MAILRVSMVFLSLYIITVQTAPTDIKNNDIQSMIFYEENDNQNPASLNNLRRKFKSQNQNIKVLRQEHNKPAELTSITNQLASKSKVEIKVLNKFPQLEDMRQNWGILVNEASLDDEDEAIYSRPIDIPKPDSNIDTLKEAKVQPSLAATPLSAALVSENTNNLASGLDKKEQGKPTSCDIALVSCCMKGSPTENCFSSHGCFKNLVNGKSDACQKNNLLQTLKKIKDNYT